MSKTNKILFTALSACLLTVAFSSCTRIKNYISNLSKDEKNPVIARVYDTYLYRSDLPNIVPAGASKEDSTAIIDRYIDSWVTRQLILNATQMSMPAGDLEKEIAEFKELLLTGRYEQFIISQRLDTSVTEAEIKKYYEENKENFILHKDIVSWSYLPVTYCDDALLKKLRTAFARDKAPAPARKAKNSAPQEETPWNWYRDVEQVMEEESYNAPFIKDEWAEVESIQNKYETDKDFAASAVQKNGYSFVVRNNDGVYLGRIMRVVRRGSQAPMEYVNHQIKGIILNRRKSEVLHQAEAELKQQAEENNKFEIFNRNEDK